MENKNGGPAFPTQNAAEYIHGMSLRDWFAGQALNGLCFGCAGMLGNEFTAYAKGPCNSVLTERAYLLADAMLKERASDDSKT